MKERNHTRNHHWLASGGRGDQYTCDKCKVVLNANCPSEPTVYWKPADLFEVKAAILGLQKEFKKISALLKKGKK